MKSRAEKYIELITTLQSAVSDLTTIMLFDGPNDVEQRMFEDTIAHLNNAANCIDWARCSISDGYQDDKSPPWE